MKQILFIFLFIYSLNVQAKVVLPTIYSDGMVLQRNQPIRIWGQAAPKEKVIVTFAGQQQVVNANTDGHWETRLSPLKEGVLMNYKFLAKKTR